MLRQRQLFAENFLLRAKFRQLLRQFCPARYIEQRHATGAGAQRIQLAARGAPALVDLHRDLSVDFGAGQLFQQLGAFAGFGIQEGGKLALRQHH